MTVMKDSDGFRLTFDEEIPEEERRFYAKVYPTVNLVTERRVHCTVCGVHIGTAPSNESVIRMHPILKVTHCKKCHEFYNSGEFSKGEDGSELYCRWCGQGGEVYCCSKCPYVFCTNCIVQNLTKDCVNDIEENENWNCFVCAPKIMWHLRGTHWALMNFIEKQKQNILDKNLSESAIRRLMTKDLATCCKPKGGNISDSSCDSESSLSRKRKAKAGSLEKKIAQYKPIMPKPGDEETSPESKKSKPNDEVVCTPDVLSLIAQTPTASVTKVTPPTHHNNGVREQLAVQEKPKPKPTPPPTQSTAAQVQTTIPRQIQVRQISASQQTANHASQPVSLHSSLAQTTLQMIQTQANNAINAVSSTQAPPLAIRTLSNASTQIRGGTPALVSRKTIVGSRPPASAPGASPVYHTINGYRIDLNTAAQQETFRLPNGKLIQVKRQGTAQAGGVTVTTNSPGSNTPAISLHQQNPMNRPPHLAQIQPQQNRNVQGNTINPQNTSNQQQQQSMQQFTIQQPSLATIRYAPATGQIIGANGTTIQTTNTTVMMNGSNPLTTVAIRPAVQQPTLIKQIFASTPLGQARSQLQNQIFASMDICNHLIGKVHTLTNSNAYKTAKNFTDVKELYIHLSYLFTYAIGRFKTIQEKCMDDMRCLGFAGDAATLESGQLEKYASDNDEDDIVIVEPKTTCINLDSDNEEDEAPKSRQPKKSPAVAAPKKSTTPPNLAAKPIQRQPTQQQAIQTQTVQQRQQPQQAPVTVSPVTISKPPPLLVKPVGTVMPPIGNIPAIVRPVEMSQLQMQQQAHIQQQQKQQQQKQIQAQQQLQLQQQQIQQQQQHKLHQQQLQILQQPQIRHSQSTTPPQLPNQQIQIPPPILHPPQPEVLQPQIAQVQSLAIESPNPVTPSPAPSLNQLDSMECDLDFTANLLAGMLDVELHEGTETVQIATPPKKPRKKTTNKPNPHLIKQQEIQARERELELIKHDNKLNRQCLISLERIEETNEDAKKKLEDFIACGSETSSPSGEVVEGEVTLSENGSLNKNPGSVESTEVQVAESTEVQVVESKEVQNESNSNDRKSSVSNPETTTNGENQKDEDKSEEKVEETVAEKVEDSSVEEVEIIDDEKETEKEPVKKADEEEVESIEVTPETNAADETPAETEDPSVTVRSPSAENVLKKTLEAIISEAVSFDENTQDEELIAENIENQSTLINPSAEAIDETAENEATIAEPISSVEPVIELSGEEDANKIENEASSSKLDTGVEIVPMETDDVEEPAKNGDDTTKMDVDNAPGSLPDIPLKTVGDSDGISLKKAEEEAFKKLKALMEPDEENEQIELLEVIDPPDDDDDEPDVVTNMPDMPDLDASMPGMPDLGTADVPKSGTDESAKAIGPDVNAAIDGLVAPDDNSTILEI